MRYVSTKKISTKKSWQVQYMWNIYQQADHTVAWLGEGTDESDQLMAQMNLSDDNFVRDSPGAAGELNFQLKPSTIGLGVRTGTEFGFNKNRGRLKMLLSSAVRKSYLVTTL
jgi:hypothetical protein